MTGKEILPPMLYELFWNSAVSFNGEAHDQHFKAGMECTYKALLPYLKAALPHYEARIRDTRLGRADERLVLALAQFKELVMNQTHDMPNMPIGKNDQLERYRAFVSDVYDIEMDQNLVESIMCLSRKHGLFPVSLKAPG